MAKIGWFLNVLMARWHISNADLAEAMGRHPTSISRLRTARSMPRMSGEDLGRLCDALSALSGKEIEPNDLLME
jgi:DNA-binding Xre family transcriptional regulator